MKTEIKTNQDSLEHTEPSIEPSTSRNAKVEAINSRLFICILACVIASTSLYAQDQRRQGGRGRPEFSAELKKALEECHSSLKIAKPSEAPSRLSRTEMEKIKVCVESKGQKFPAPPDRSSSDGEERGGHRGPPPEDFDEGNSAISTGSSDSAAQ